MKNLLQPGIYKFKITHVDCDYTSQAGNKSIKLIFDIVDTNGKNNQIFDFLTKKLDPKTNKTYVFIIKRIEGLLKSTGKLDLFGKVLNNSDLLGAVGHASIKIEPSNGAYGDVNKIDRFIPAEEVSKSFVVNDKKQLNIQDGNTVADDFFGGKTTTDPDPIPEFGDSDIPF